MHPIVNTNTEPELARADWVKPTLERLSLKDAMSAVTGPTSSDIHGYS